MPISISWFVGVLLLGFALDWLICTRMAAYRTDCDYSYRPSSIRYGLLVLAAATFAYAKVIYDERSTLALIALGALVLALLVYSQVAARDVKRDLVQGRDAND